MEIPSSHAGVVKELKVKVGDTVNEGSVILSLEAAGAARLPPAPAPAAHRGAGRQAARGRRRARAAGRDATPAAPTSNATCSCSAPARAATRRPSAPPTSA